MFDYVRDGKVKNWRRVDEDEDEDDDDALWWLVGYVDTK